MPRSGSKSPKPGSKRSPRTPKERRKSEINEERKAKAQEMADETGLPLFEGDEIVIVTKPPKSPRAVSKSPRSGSKKSPRTPKARRKSEIKAKAEEMAAENGLPLTSDEEIVANKRSKSPHSGSKSRSNSKSPRKNPRLPARKTEEDEERKSKGKEIAAEKGLLWTKEVPKEGKIYAPVLRDDSHLAHKEIGFLDIGKAEPTHAYDVGGDWKLLYKKPGARIGPGMSPRASPAPSPKPKKTRLPPPMKIYIRKWDGTRLCLENIKPDDTIYEIQNRIEDEHNIPRRQQRLRFGSRPLDNSKETLKDCGIVDCSTLDLDPFNVHVRAPDGRKCTLPVEPDYTIPEIKDLVEKELGIPPENQRPTFDGKPLPDNSTLDDNGIGHGDIIDLTPMKITVRAPDGRTCELDVSPEDTIPDIKKQVKKNLGIPTKQQRPTFNDKLLPDDSNLRDNGIEHGDVIDLQPMQIKVRAPDGSTVTLDVNPEDSIPKIKKQVENELDIPVEDQRPLFKNKPLYDNSTLEDNGIKHGDVIDLAPMEIFVETPDGRKTPFKVTPDDTIEEIKERVEKKLGIPTEDQRPRFNNSPLSDDSTLRDNGVRHRDTIVLEPMKIKVVAPDGRSTDIVVTPDSTIDDVKKCVDEKLAIPPEDQRPEFNGTPLDDDSATLEDNNIRHGDTIHLKPMQIQVKAPDGRIANLEVSPDDTIDNVKKQVKKELGIPTKEQRPTFNDEPLPKKSTLKDNGIRHGDMIELQPMEIYVIDLNGNKGTYMVDPLDSIGDLKSRVEGKTGVEPKDQRLVFEENLLTDDDKTLRDVNIEHQDTLTLEPFRVHVRMPGGKKLTLENINPRIATPMEVKNKVNKLEGIVPKKQILKFKGEELDSPRPLADFGVQHDDTIDLRLTAPMPKLHSPEIKKDYLKTLDPDRYGRITVTTYKTRYDGEPGESFIDGPGKKDVTDFKFEKVALKSQEV